MQFRQVPRNGDELPVPGAGCMTLPERKGGIGVARTKGSLEDFCKGDGGSA